MKLNEQASNIRNTLLSGLFFGGIAGVTIYLLSRDLSFSLNSALFAGFSFSLIAYIFIKVTSKNLEARIVFPHEETVLLTGGANHFREYESVGGFLYLTAQRLVFHPHSFNAQLYETSIPLTEIADLALCNSLGFIPNGIQITLINGEQHTFIVNRREKWLQEIALQLLGI